MKNKNLKNNNSTDHLNDVIFSLPAASATDFTGYMPARPDTDEKAENVSMLMNVPTSPPCKKKAAPKNK